MDMDLFINIPAIWLALFSGLFTWVLTSLGASMVFFFKSINRKILDSALGFAAGVMIAASFFSLIIPGLDYAEQYNSMSPVLIIVIGFLIGAYFIVLVEKIVPHKHIFERNSEGGSDEIRKGMKTSKLLFLAMTIHNIPEGLAIGVGFGAYSITNEPSILWGAIALAIGIGLQNVPEGLAISFPMSAGGSSKKSAFFLGSVSAIVEPIAAVLGVILVFAVQSILAFALAFAAGAMIFVVVEQLIPESQLGQNRKLSTFSTLVGLAVMMSLDVLLS